MIFELLNLDLNLSLQLPREISSPFPRGVQHDLKYTGTNILVLVLLPKGSGNSVITPASCPLSNNLSQFKHRLTEISGLLLFTPICEKEHVITETPGLLSRREVKNLIASRCLHRRVDFWGVPSATIQ